MFRSLVVLLVVGFFLVGIVGCGDDNKTIEPTSYVPTTNEKPIMGGGGGGKGPTEAN